MKLPFNKIFKKKEEKIGLCSFVYLTNNHLK